MDVHKMMNSLGFRLGDASKRSFTNDMKLKTLNNAQFTLLNKLNPYYLSEIQEIETGLTATAGQYSLTSLNYPVLNGSQGIMHVKINGTAVTSQYCTRIDVKDRKTLENIYKKGTTFNPVYYVFDEKIFVLNGETNPTIDVYYMRQPATMMYIIDIIVADAPSKTGFQTNTAQGLHDTNDHYNGGLIYVIGQDEYHIIDDYTYAADDDTTFATAYDAGANFGTDQIYFIMNDYDGLTFGPGSDDYDAYTTECQLNQSFHELVITYAAAECFGMDKRYDEGNAEYARADLVVAALNDQYQRAEGIGTYR